MKMPNPTINGIPITNWDEGWADFRERFAKAFRQALQEKLGQGAQERGFNLGDLQRSIKVIDRGTHFEIKMKKYGFYVEYGTPGRIDAPEGMSPNPGRKYPMNYLGKDAKGKKKFEYKEEYKQWMENKAGATSKEDQFKLTRHIVMHGSRPYPFIRSTFKKDFIPLMKKALKRSFK